MEKTKLDLKREKTYQKYQLDPQRIPQHVAIIMDGNGRWAKKRFLPRAAGHKAGAEALRKTIKSCVELNIKYLTVYVFSTENWKRPKTEVSFLMNLLKELIIKEIPALNKEGARVRCLGAMEELPKKLQEKIKEAEKETKNNKIININLMINYGSRKELTESIKKINQDLQTKKLTFSEINEETISQYLYTKEIPDPDLLIRTGGDIRISNYLLWQIAYSELFFLDTLWPDFNKEHLFSLVKKFQDRERRFGGIK
jgi:undecaprenyl diphosphate synthase